MRAVAFASQSGGITMSSSRIAVSGLLLEAKPMLNVSQAPKFGCGMTTRRTSGNSRRTISAVPSVEALSTTTMASKGSVWACSESRFSRRSAALFQVETTAVVRGVGAWGSGFTRFGPARIIGSGPRARKRESGSEGHEGFGVARRGGQPGAALGGQSERHAREVALAGERAQFAQRGALALADAADVHEARGRQRRRHFAAQDQELAPGHLERQLSPLREHALVVALLALPGQVERARLELDQLPRQQARAEEQLLGRGLLPLGVVPEFVALESQVPARGEALAAPALGQRLARLGAARGAGAVEDDDDLDTVALARVQRERAAAADEFVARVRGQHQHGAAGQLLAGVGRFGSGRHRRAPAVSSTADLRDPKWHQRVSSSERMYCATRRARSSLSGSGFQS